jgi:methionyl-tRNA formyltransferase
VRIAFAGTPQAAVPTLQALIGTEHVIEFVITRPDAPKGRGRALTPSPVAEVAEQAGLKVIKTSNISELADQLNGLDAIVVVAFGGLVPKNLLSVPKHGWINVHFSLLPHWRGAAPVQHAIMAGDDVIGVTTFRIEEALDTGPMLAYLTTSIGPSETAGELLDRLSIEGANLAIATLSGLEQGTMFALEQPIDGVSYAPKITTELARINWQDPALAVARKIRAVTPAPGAWTMVGEERFKLMPVQLATHVIDLAPGELKLEENQVYVGTGSHAVLLTQIQSPGKTFANANDWARNLKTNLVFL